MQGACVLYPNATSTISIWGRFLDHFVYRVVDIALFSVNRVQTVVIGTESFRTSCLPVRENVARCTASDTTEGADCYSDGDRSNAPQMPVAAYSDLLFSFATVEGKKCSSLCSIVHFQICLCLLLLLQNTFYLLFDIH